MLAMGITERRQLCENIVKKCCAGDGGLQKIATDT
jgi:hypothetical protein